MSNPELQMWVNGQRVDFDVVEWQPRWRWLPERLWERWPHLLAKHVRLVVLKSVPAAGNTIVASYSYWMTDDQ